MKDSIFDMDKYAATARAAVAEGIVLLRNREKVLPLSQASRIALFGLSQFHYYKSGTGSGGMVNTSHVVDIREALHNEPLYTLNNKLEAVYNKWLEVNPFVEGIGWANEPWFQEEMPITSDLVKMARKDSDVAFILIGRTAGEDQDNVADVGSYLLTDNERMMLKEICAVFEKTVVLLNVGNIIDMKWVDEYNPSAVLYVWQGGQEGGNGVVDVLKGKVAPSGKLADTIAYNIEDYPSHANYGDEVRNFYAEDIYVGYRYFETFAKEKVMYPFGFGLSYTNFSKELLDFQHNNEEIIFTIKITNTGIYAGKEVIQLYCEAPQGRLGKPARGLIGFAKTKCLAVGESTKIVISCLKYYLASFDDSGVTGIVNSFVLEAGTYNFYLGDDVRNAVFVEKIVLSELQVLATHEKAAAPVLAFERMKVKEIDKNQYQVDWEPVPLRTIKPKERRAKNLPEEIVQRGDKGYKLADVAIGQVDMNDFVAQLSDEDLCCIIRGEGMCSEKVTPGTAGAFGGVSDSLAGFGIPVACCADGPSGLRMDCGTVAFSMPNGACFASTFNEDLMTKLYEFEGLELRKNQIDILLGPGMDIHRHPLNGRNFEYWSEDPLLTGKMSAAQLRGMHKYGVTGTLKHFTCNNQEFRRTFVETVISQRALREIYLRGYEIAVKEGGAYTIMTTYGPLNGFWTASNYDLCTEILRNEWGFDGLVMTDWWAKGNDEGEEGTLENVASMVRAQNDLQMVTRCAIKNTNNDNLAQALITGQTSRGEYQRSAANILRTILRLPVFNRSIGKKSELDVQLEKLAKEEDLSKLRTTAIEVVDEASIDSDYIDTGKNQTNLFQLNLKNAGKYKITITCRTNIETVTAQLPLSIFFESELLSTISLTGADKTWMTFELLTNHVDAGNRFLKLFFSLGGIEINELNINLLHL
jgi:beta-glucosidase